MESESVNVCLPDCRIAGCGIEGICNTESGVCELQLEEEGFCRWECAENEVCTEGSCLRADGSCVTDYHCPERETCVEGQCQTRFFASCDMGFPVNETCAEGQQCINTQSGGACFFSCAANADCPMHMTCQVLAQGLPQLCYYEFCDANELNGPCTIEEGRPGTCRPLQEAFAEAGLCLEAGEAANGADCESEADARNPDDRALICAPGNLCTNDPDNALDPADENDERGTCSALCNPVAADMCGEGAACIQFGRPDNPQTPDDETFNFGLCRPTDCTLLGDECGEGQTCQALTFASANGTCRDIGELGLGESCETNEDCGANTVCGNAGSGPICIAYCEEGEQVCPWGQTCAPTSGGVVNVCL
jgi:hypothetical protein